MLFIVATAFVVVVAIAGGIYFSKALFGVDLMSGWGVQGGGGTTNPAIVTGDGWYYTKGGQLTINVNPYYTYNQSVVAANLPVMKVYHADRSTLFGTVASGTGGWSVTGSLTAADNGILWFVVDDNAYTSNYYFMDSKTTLDNNKQWVKDLQPWDCDLTGTLCYAYKVDVTKLPDIKAGQQLQTFDLYMYFTPYEATPGYTQLGANATSVSTTAYTDYYSEGYISSFTSGGYGVKLTKMTVTLPNAANGTYVEDGNLRMVSVQINYSGSIGTKTYSGSDLSYDTSARRWTVDLDVDDINNEYYGQLVQKGRSDGDTFAKVTIHWFAKFPAGGQVIVPTAKLYTIAPDGTPGNFEHIFSLTS